MKASVPRGAMKENEMPGGGGPAAEPAPGQGSESLGEALDFVRCPCPWADPGRLAGAQPQGPGDPAPRVPLNSDQATDPAEPVSTD